MELVGAKLKKIRLEKGLTLEEAHKKTKIHLSILKAIEEGGVANLSPVYLRGFVKLYCEFLGVDYRDYIVDYRQPQTPIKYTHPENNKPKPVSFIQSASAKMGSLEPPKKFQIYIIIVLAVIFLLGIFSLGKFIALRRHNTQRKSQSSQNPTSRISRKSDDTRLQKNQALEFNPKPTIVSTVSGNTISGVRLTVSAARDDCWIKVKCDGKLLYYGILKKGRFDTWQAKDKINLYLGNAGVVDLNVNGQVITSLGRKGQVLTDIVITKEGLSVLR